MRRWKDAGARRAIFLPMRDFLTRPSQFIRVVTAARRGQADGVCGFSMGVSAAPPEQQWQWKSVTLAGLANFPTRELDAYCLMEEPAELLDVLGESQTVCVVAGGDPDEVVDLLSSNLGGDVRVVTSVADAPDDALAIVMGPNAPLPASMTGVSLNPDKGLLFTNGSAVYVTGGSFVAVDAAAKFLERFIELVPAERDGLVQQH